MLSLCIKFEFTHSKDGIGVPKLKKCQVTDHTPFGQFIIHRPYRVPKVYKDFVLPTMCQIQVQAIGELFIVPGGAAGKVCYS